jgi:putative endonuclease
MTKDLTGRNLEKEGRHKRIGRCGEDLAVQLLKKKGYKILERNYKSSLGEIDIIAQEGKVLVFAEVKTRSTSDFGSAKWAVDARKQRKLSMLALGYLKSRSLIDQPSRFDVVAIDRDQGQEKIELIRNAFDLAY